MISSYRRQHRAPRRAGRPPWGIAALWTCVPGAAWYLGRVPGRGVVRGWLGFVGETGVGAALLGWRWTRGHWRANAAAPRGSAPAW